MGRRPIAIPPRGYVFEAEEVEEEKNGERKETKEETKEVEVSDPKESWRKQHLDCKRRRGAKQCNCFEGIGSVM